MKNHEDNWSERNRDKKHFKEQKSQAFRCGHCRALVVVNEFMGTKNRNHCNLCLWSKHVDMQKGDRSCACRSGMQPIGLTTKREGFSRWGELMLVHLCISCEALSINRIAADDNTEKILSVFEASLRLEQVILERLEHETIYLLQIEDAEEVAIQLSGK